MIYRAFGKRAFDIIASLAFLVILSPFLIFFSLLNLVCSGAPIFYTQLRSGIHNESFTIIKFRTMGVKSENVIAHQYVWNQGVPEQFIFDKPTDFKVTAIGRIYRKYSIDEIPQIWNVLKGEMSFIGPRPEMIEITKHYSSEQKKRLHVRPGITGYAQVNGRSTLTHGQKIKYDLYYAENYSFAMDVKILIKTFFLVFSGKGAC